MRQGNAASPLVFCSPRGGILRRSDFRVRHWNPLLKLLGLDHRGMHHLRHTYATLALGTGVPVHVVARVLGHSKPSITLDIYSHVLSSQQAEATEAMRRLFG
jgi:integrase